MYRFFLFVKVLLKFRKLVPNVNKRCIFVPAIKLNTKT